MNENGNKKGCIGCLSCFVGWLIITAGITVIFKRINTQGESTGNIIFMALLLGLCIVAFIFFFIAVIVSIKSRILRRKNKKKKPFINPYVDAALYHGQGRFPKVNYNNVFLEEGEWIIYASPARAYTEKEQAKGRAVQNKHSKGRRIKRNIKNFNAGDYVVTNRRVVFVSQSERFEVNVNKISELEIVTENAMILMSENKQRNIVVDETQLAVAFTTTKLMMDASAKYEDGMPIPPYLLLDNLNEAMDDLEEAVTKLDQKF